MSQYDSYRELKDGDLWVELQNDDREALNEIYKRYIDLLYAYGSKLSGDRSLVEDCIHEIFITLWTKRHRLKTTGSIKFYLFKALKRRIFRHSKKAARQGIHFDFSDPSFSAMLRYEPPSGHMDEQTLQKINQSLQKLTSRQKEVIYLRFYAHMEFSEIAEVMDLTTKATYKLLARAIARLKKNFIFF